MPKELTDLCALARNTRRAQAEYFKRRSPLALGEAKKLERELDLKLDQLEAQYKK